MRMLTAVEYAVLTSPPDVVVGPEPFASLIERGLLVVVRCDEHLAFTQLSSMGLLAKRVYESIHSMQARFP